MFTSKVFADTLRKTLVWKEDNDCCVKAMAIAFDISYAEAWYACRKQGRVFKTGMKMDEFVKAAGAKATAKGKYFVPVDYNGTVLDFMQNNTGSYIFECDCHVFAVTNGVVHDNTDNWRARVASIESIISIHEVTDKALYSDWPHIETSTSCTFT